MESTQNGACVEGLSGIALIRWVPAAVLLLWLVLTAIAFTSIYEDGHPYEVASRWIYRNVEPGAKILEGHWDDTLPITLPGVPPVRYQREGREWELGLYEADSPEKLARVSSQLARGDYIVFPTQRLHGSLMRVPEEFPQTNALYQLLFSGQLGYQLAYTYKKEPALLGIVFDDDLADESLSVYDHPKVTIFRNVERFTAAEIRRRIENVREFAPLPSRDEIMRVDGSGNQERG